MARENRDVRPFDDLPEVQSWLEDKVILRIYPTGSAGQIEPLECVANSTLRVDPSTPNFVRAQTSFARVDVRLSQDQTIHRDNHILFVQVLIQ